MDIENDIVTNDGEDTFQIRLIKSEGIGLVTTKSGKNYLILDSSDYWYDLIQVGYPKIKKCSCKNDWFKVKFKYYYREHYDDIRRIEVKTICVNCSKVLIVSKIDIKYSPTEQLIKTPLVYCENPDIKCKIKAIMQVLELNDFYKILDYFSEIGFLIYCWYWNYESKKREFKMFSEKEIKQLNISSIGHFSFIDKFFNIYIANETMNVDNCILTTDKHGIYMKENLWRKEEIIAIGNLYMVNEGMYYMFQYSTQFIKNTGEVENKSEEFAEKILKFENWFNEKYKKIK